MSPVITAEKNDRKPARGRRWLLALLVVPVLLVVVLLVGLLLVPVVQTVPFRVGRARVKVDATTEKGICDMYGARQGFNDLSDSSTQVYVLRVGNWGYIVHLRRYQ